MRALVVSGSMKADSRGAGWGGGGAVCAGSLRRVGLYKAEEGGEIATGIGKRRLTMGPKKTNKQKTKQRLEKKIPQVVILA